MHIFRQGSLEGEGFCGDWMMKFQLPGVKRLSLEILIIGIVEKVAGEWITNMFHMYSNLVCASCFKIQLNQRVFATAF